jgi:hypothetical protein
VVAEGARAVKSLVHEVGVPVRVKDKVHQPTETVQAKVDEVRQRLHQGLHKGTETLQGKADEASLHAKSLMNRTVATLPPPVTGRVRQLAEKVRHRPVPATAFVLLGVFMMLRRLLRRNR